MNPDAQVALANKLIKEVQAQLDKDQGATLLLFPLGRTDGITTYISTADRHDMREVMRELVERWDKGESIRGGGLKEDLDMMVKAFDLLSAAMDRPTDNERSEWFSKAFEVRNRIAGDS